MQAGLAAFLRLCRVGMLFSPAADVVAGMCLSGAPWTTELARAAGASVLLYAAGMVLNDHADRVEDATDRPEQPIPSGAISPAMAAAVGFGLIAAALLSTPALAYHASMAALVLAYDYALKRSPLAGAVTMGVLRGANLMAGAFVAGGGMPTDPVIWSAAGAYGLYILAVTVLGIYEDEPRVSARAVVGVQAVPPIVSCLVLLALPRPWPAAAIGFALALAFSHGLRRRGARWDTAAIRASMTWLLLGTMLYTSLLCLGSGRLFESLGIAAAILPARAISRRIALT